VLHNIDKENKYMWWAFKVGTSKLICLNCSEELIIPSIRRLRKVKLASSFLASDVLRPR